MMQMHSTVYTIAFSNDEFLMVYHPRRGGWEMPGGKIEKGETPEQAAEREFVEESGYSVHVVKTRDLGHCFVCAAVLGDRISDTYEMETCFFDEIPEKISFDREEYDDTVPWARKAVENAEIEPV